MSASDTEKVAKSKRASLSKQQKQSELSSEPDTPKLGHVGRRTRAKSVQNAPDLPTITEATAHQPTPVANPSRNGRKPSVSEGEQTTRTRKTSATHSDGHAPTRARSNSKKSSMPPLHQTISPCDWDSDIDVFSYHPDDATGAGDPYADEDDGLGQVWSFHYFFYNRRFKRVVFFTMRGVRFVVDCTISFIS
jgi:hypothetical protein